MSSKPYGPQSPAAVSEVPEAASITRRLSALVIEVLVFHLAFLGLVQLGLGTGGWSAGTHPAPLLALAVVRVLGETAWGTSPGKYLTDLQVEYRTRTGRRIMGWARVPPAVLRNGWLWLPALMVLIDSSYTWYNGLAAVVALTVVIRWDNRSVVDLLAGAEVLSSKHTVSAPEPRTTPWPTSAPPQRALAWAVDLGVSAAVGVLLSGATAWSFWPTTLAVLGVLRLVTEWVGLPTPGKAVMGLQVYYLAWFDVRALVFIQVVVRNLWIPVAVAYAASPYATPLLFEAVIMVFITVFPDHRGVTDLLANAHVVDVRGPAQEM